MNRTKGIAMAARHGLTPREREVLLGGGLLSWTGPTLRCRQLRGHKALPRAGCVSGVPAPAKERGARA